MRYAACKPADGLHFVRLAEAKLERLLILLRFLKICTHTVKRAGDFGDFVTAGAFERIVEVALFERANAGYQAGQWSCKGVANHEDERAARQNAKQRKSDQDAIQCL